jgi:DNA topoisomerase IB
MAARIRRSDCSGPGITRVRRGKGFAYLDAGGEHVTDEETLARIRSLAVPPAWKDVWICADPRGHLQAVGIDDAGRRQYLYHERWRRHRDREKFDKMLDFARALPKLRRAVKRDIAGDELTRERVLAGAVRLLDHGFFRIGSESYAEQNESYGLATLKKGHVRVADDMAVFDYVAKSGQRRVQTIHDPAAIRLIRQLKARRSGSDELLAWRDGRRWADVQSSDINEYLKGAVGEEFSAKDFRTWNATVLAAVWLAANGSLNGTATKTSRKRMVTEAVKAVAFFLGNTPAVCRNSYIDPRVFDRYASGWTVGGALTSNGEGAFIQNDRVRTRIERGVIDLLEERRRSPALERVD